MVESNIALLESGLEAFDDELLVEFLKEKIDTLYEKENLKDQSIKKAIHLLYDKYNVI